MADETVLLVISTFEKRQEVDVPVEFIEEGSTVPTQMLLSFLRESNITYPEGGMITKIESGYTFHEVPKFG